MHTKATEVGVTLASAQETRRQWANLTEPTRSAALAADAELRRRHPDARLVPVEETRQAQAQSARESG
jgi:hypothetical protein